MSHPVNTGGPAFPRAAIGEDCGRPYGQQEGMSLRDWFAGQAMQAIANDMAGVVATADEHGVNPTVLMARLAYGVADAMLAARDAPAKAEVDAEAGGSDD